MMSNWQILVQEVHEQLVRVSTEEAKTAEEARTIAAEGGGENVGPTKYIYTLDPDTWYVINPEGALYALSPNSNR